MNLFKYGSLLALMIVVITGCNSTGTTTTPDTVSNSIFPDWYVSSGASSDSLSYSGYATAIATDSLLAIERAEEQARAHLETSIAELTEDVRNAMVDAGSSNAGQTDFIIILRTAHSKVEGAASLTNSSAKSSDGYFRGFAAVTITRSELASTLEKGFNGHPRYWGDFSSADLFEEYFK